MSGDLGYPGGPAGEIRVLIADNDALVRQKAHKTLAALRARTLKFRLEITAAICAHDRPFSFTGQACLGESGRIVIHDRQAAGVRAHQRKAFLSRCVAGALLRRCPCIAVMGMVPGSV